ncbi:MAG TPA: ADP-ribosylation factor-like protein [Candidatus Lokiarchaeia archaeon]|nr:ADP-ribosylation factor-like protein [Candidatus Lokiarchaeia archaeon]
MFMPVDETNPEIPSKKIIFTGLDNSGKSSIILALQRSLANLATLTPTKMVERSTFNYMGYTISSHDLGGQKKYLITYLKQPGKYFSETSVMIYVIDYQDAIRYDESLSYFKDVLDQFQTLEMMPLIFVFFHKTEKIVIEGDQEDEIELEGSGMHKIKLLENKIEEINAGRFTIEYKLTTIFDPWSITSAFSDIMLRLFPRSILLDKALEEFASSNRLDALLLLDSNALNLGTFYSTKDAEKIIRSSTPYFLTLLDSWKPIDPSNEPKLMKVTLNEYAFFFREIQQKLQEDQEKYMSFYFLAMSHAEFNIEYLDEFSKMVLGILRQ